MIIFQNFPTKNIPYLYDISSLRKRNLNKYQLCYLKRCLDRDWNKNSASECNLVGHAHPSIWRVIEWCQNFQFKIVNVHNVNCLLSTNIGD
jgi:hypothetical protein